ncbi:MAG TPA: beta-galactosidase trimerization domain-containing protein [Bryobacteraceae bacterium]|nr:beta-galactosidase trimerization domain-containing protein [Bryobacteraceae bacterium]
MWTRRQFQELALAAALPAQEAKRPAAADAWYDRPMRWAQVAFVEDDPDQYSLDFWLDYFRRIHADAACLSAGGCIAFYPTQVPYHYRSQFLGGTDPFGEFVQGCRRLNMNVIARTDPHAMHADAYRAHPEWAAVDAEGQPRKHWAMPAYWVTCCLGPYSLEFMRDVTQEIVKTYDVDGVFSNRWHGSGKCFCRWCQTEFRIATGLGSIPVTNDPADAGQRQYLEWHQERLFAVWDALDREVRALRPRASFIANAGGGALSELDMNGIGKRAETLFADRQARRGLMAPWANGMTGKEYRAAMGKKPIGGIVSVGVEEPYRWKDSVQSNVEIRLWFAEGIANGLRPWFTKFNAKVIDKRWLPAVEAVYQWHWKNEKYLRNTAPVARVAMAYSQQTAHYYGGLQAKARVEDPALGYYHALIEARIPFEMVHDRRLDEESLAPFRTLILPNIACLSDSQCEQIRAFVKRGGSVVATGETSLYDEWGKARSDFGLAGLFGCSFTGKIETRMQNAYLTCRHPHPLLRGLEEAPRVIHGVRRVATAAISDADVPLTLVPSYPDLPMEEVYPRRMQTNQPECYARESGSGGRIVYFPFDIDRTFWEVMAPDHGTLLRNAVAWATREAPVVEVTGPGLLDVTVWRQAGSLTVHLVNLTNPMTMKGPYRETFPVGPLRVFVPNSKPKAVRLLTAGAAAVWKAERGGASITVPSVDLHEVVALDV